MNVAVFAALALAWLHPGGVSAQTTIVPPTSGALSQESLRQQRQLEQQLKPRARPLATPDISGPERSEDDIGDDTGPKFKLTAVTFSRSAFLSPPDLQAIAAKYTGREITFADLQRILADVNALYGARGIITALATLPPQKIKGGVVKIKLTEGRHAAVNVIGATTLSDDYVLSRFPVTEGEIVDPDVLREKVRHYNLRNSNQLRVLLKPGKSFGQTDLDIAVAEPPMNTLEVFFNNHGTVSTGEYQRGFLFQRYGLFGFDDRLTIYGTNARQTSNGNLSYNFPVGVEGHRAGFSLSRGDFAIVDGPFSILDVAGVSDTVELNYAHLLYVSDVRRLSATFSGQFGQSETEYSDVRVTDENFYQATAGFTFSHVDEAFYVSISPDLVFVSHENEIIRHGTDFMLFAGAASGVADLPTGLRLTGDVSWQVTGSKLLPGSQLFQIGGPTTVRGYPASGASGDSGYLVSAELHRHLDELREGLDLYAFVDHGAVYSTFPEHTSVTSIGVGVNFEITEFIGLDVNLAFPVEEVFPDQDDVQVYARVLFDPLAFPATP
ncbi:MAG: ShlB/FhaC/HecB family hemolysin secretion/activation protein [Pseudomonadota bacterium]